jgi:hypothetical protein
MIMLLNRLASTEYGHAPAYPAAGYAVAHAAHAAFAAL